jgi:hypothetical protein
MDPGERFDSWKAIAAYLKRDESTVRRWEKEGLPVHRHMHAKKASIYAYRAEIDSWWNSGRVSAKRGTVATLRHRLTWWFALCLTLVAAGVGWIVLTD